MDQTWFNIAITALGGMAGWWMNVMWQNLKDLEKADRLLIDRVAAIDLLVAGQYVRRDHFEVKMTELTNALFGKLDRIEDKLDRKVDKGLGG
jgi:hypothetical protein